MSPVDLEAVMAGHVPAIHAVDAAKAWMPGTRPGMTAESNRTPSPFVMAGLVPAIHAFDSAKAWMPGTRPGMTTEKLPLRLRPGRLRCI
jgi:hypothetical protein